MRKGLSRQAIDAELDGEITTTCRECKYFGKIEEVSYEGGTHVEMYCPSCGVVRHLMYSYGASDGAWEEIGNKKKKKFVLDDHE